jgi:hypothetical protein
MLTIEKTFSYNDFMYQIGLSYDNPTTTSLFAPINSNGSLGSWGTTTPAFSSCTSSICPVAQSADKIYGLELGTTTIYHSVIKNNGHISEWSSSPGVLVTSSLDMVTVWDGNLYTNAGLTAGLGSTNKIHHLKLSDKNTYWGLNVPTGNPSGTYTGIVTYTSAFSQ